MNNKISISIISLIFIMFILVPVIAFSEPSMKSSDSDKGKSKIDKKMLIDKFLIHLNLTPEQIELVEKTNEEYGELFSEFKKKFKEKRQAIMEILDDENLDKNEEILNIVQEIKLLREDILKKKQERENAIKKLLTPDQLENLNNLKEKIKNKIIEKKERKKKK